MTSSQRIAGRGKFPSGTPSPRRDISRLPVRSKEELMSVIEGAMTRNNRKKLHVGGPKRGSVASVRGLPVSTITPTPVMTSAVYRGTSISETPAAGNGDKSMHQKLYKNLQTKVDAQFRHGNPRLRYEMDRRVVPIVGDDDY